eukprot:COSAG01_NODE_22165_length_868_cov_2.235371_2_plen_110_part_00
MRGRGRGGTRHIANKIEDNGERQCVNAGRNGATYSKQFAAAKTEVAKAEVKAKRQAKYDTFNARDDPENLCPGADPTQGCPGERLRRTKGKGQPRRKFCKECQKVIDAR